MGKNRHFFSLVFLVALVLYLLTPFLPETDFSLLVGAAGVVAFSFLFLGRAAQALQAKRPSNALLFAAALFSILGVYGLNRSLYNFETTPPVGGSVFSVEEAGRVIFVEKTGDEPGEDRVIASYTKHFWLAKTFSINVLLLAAALSLGVLVGKQVEKASHIFAIVVLGSVMDLWSVGVGVTEEIVSSPGSSYYFLLNWPLAGKGGVTYPLIGATDFLFVALFLFLAHRFHFPVSRNVIGMAAAVAFSVLSALVLQRGMPALPFIAAAVLVLNFRAILPDRRELTQIAVGTVVLLALFSILWRVR
jgi:hypothetical protein